MDVLFVGLRLLYILIFFIAVFISLKFEWGEESKDERGKSISHTSYSIVFPLIPLGWFLIELYTTYINTLDYDAYKLVIWFLISGLMILQAIIITILRRRY